LTRTRAFLAAVLATIYPGLGHVYLRAWFRAFAWFGLTIMTVALVVPPPVLEMVETGGIGAVTEASEALPLQAALAILGVRVLNVVDAAWLGLQPRPGEGTPEGLACPNCGRELDAELDFCHWCTTPLESTAEESPADSGFY
jgi:hypothetical protein